MLYSLTFLPSKVNSKIRKLSHDQIASQPWNIGHRSVSNLIWRHKLPHSFFCSLRLQTSESNHIKNETIRNNILTEIKAFDNYIY